MFSSFFFFKKKDTYKIYLEFPGGLDGKASAHSVGDLGSIPGLGRSTHSSILAWRIPWTEGAHTYK